MKVKFTKKSINQARWKQIGKCPKLSIKREFQISGFLKIEGDSTSHVERPGNSIVANHFN